MAGYVLFVVWISVFVFPKWGAETAAEFVSWYEHYRPLKRAEVQEKLRQKAEKQARRNA